MLDSRKPSGDWKTEPKRSVFVLVSSMKLDKDQVLVGFVSPVVLLDRIQLS